jgi:hypothetical protein
MVSQRKTNELLDNHCQEVSNVFRGLEKALPHHVCENRK